MPTFSYEAINKHGSETTGTVEAGTLEAAVNRIRSLGLFPRRINSDNALIFPDRLSPMPTTRKKAKEAQLSNFTAEFADLVKSGIPLPLSLSILRDRQKPGQLRTVLSALADDVQAGTDLSAALEKHKHFFGEMYSQIVRAGEQKGKLEIALAGLADIMQERNVNSKIVRDERNNLIRLLIICQYILAYFYLSLLPSFAHVLIAAEIDLPWHVVHTIKLAAFLGMYYWPIIWLTVLAIVMLKLLERFQRIWAIRDAIAVNLPVFGELSKKIAAVQLARPLSLLISMGTSCSDSLTIAKQAITNRTIAKGIDRIASENRGDASARQLMKHVEILPLEVSLMIAAAIDVGNSEDLLRDAARLCNNHLETATIEISRRFVAGLMMLFLGLFIWFLYVMIVLNPMGYLF
jgi:type IV pilus assembly protein PilC